MAAVNAGSVFVELGAKLDRREFVAYEKQLARVQERAARKDHFKASLGANYDARAFNAYERDLKRAEHETKNLHTSTTKLGGSLKRLAGGAGVGAAFAGFAGVGLAIKGVVSQTVGFDKAMRNVNSIAQLSEKQLQSLNKQVLSLAGKTAQAPQTLAKGLYDLVSSGFDAKESMTILASSAKAATAGLTTTEVSTKAVAAVLNAYHRPAKDAANISDTLFQTVNRGVISFEDLSTTIGDVLPFAASLHVNLNQVGAALSTMTKEGLSGAEATTRVKNVMVAFLKPNQDLAAAIKATGASSGEALTKSKGYQGALEAVIKTTDGSKSSIAKLFPNIRALGGALSVTGSNAKSAHGDLKAFADVGGATDKALGQQAKSISYQWNKVKAQFAAVSIELGAKLGPAAIKAISALSKFVDQMNKGAGAGGKFVKIVQDIGHTLSGIGHFVHDHIALVKLAASAWVAYKVAVIAAGAATRGGAALSGARAVLPGAGAAGAGAAAGAGRFAGLARLGVGSTAVVGLGAFKAITDAVHGASRSDLGLLDKYAKSIERVAKAGDSEGMRKLAKQLRDTAAANKDITKGDHLKVFADALDTTAKSGGKDLGALQAAFRAMGKSSGGDLDKVKKSIGGLRGSAKPDLGVVSQAAKRAQDAFLNLRRYGNDDLDSIKKVTRKNSTAIAHDLGTKSAEGKEALARNFRAARNAIRESMNSGRTSVKAGLAEIQKLMRAELKAYGIKGDVADSLIKHGSIGATSKTGGQGKARGGWIGAPGLAGRDAVPAMLGVGEAVLNRHQQAVIEGLLGDGFLDDLFATVNKPHYLATGGRPTGLNPAVSSFAGKLNRMFGLSTTSTTGGTHAPGSYHYQGLAADVSGSASAMAKASEWIKSSGAYHSLLEGIHNPNLAVKDGKIFSGAGPFGGVWGNHADHIHVALRALGAITGGGSVTGAPATIKAPRSGLPGALGHIVQGALNTATKGANARIASAVGNMGGGDISSQGGKSSAGGQYNKGALRNLWSRYSHGLGDPNLMAAIALAESGGNPNAHNPSGATGLWQILGSILPGNLRNPVVNVRNAVAKLKSQGLGAWEAYTNGSYRQYLARGGFAGLASNVWGRATNIMGSRGKQPHLVYGYPGRGEYAHFDRATGNVKISKEMLAAARDPRNSSHDYALKSLVHEFAHARQRADVIMDNSADGFRRREGGAELFAQSATGRIMAGLGIPFRRAQTAYPSQVGWVRKHLNPAYWMHDQFARARGGFAEFARGGRARKGGHRKKSHPSVTQSAKAYLKPINALQTDRNTDYEADLADVDDLNKSYGLAERTYDLSDEELVLEDGSIDETAIQKRAAELAGLAKIRQAIIRKIRDAIRVARRAIQSYVNALYRLRGSLTSTNGKKDRAGVKALIGDYSERLGEWRGKLHDLTSDTLPSAELDLDELLKERTAVLATQPGEQSPAEEPSVPDPPDPPGTPDTPEPEKLPPTPAEIAAAGYADYQNFLSGQAQTFGQASNFVTAAQAASAGGIFSGSASSLALTAGLKNIGAGGGSNIYGTVGTGNAGPQVIIQNGGAFAQYASAPSDPHTNVAQLRYVVESGI